MHASSTITSGYNGWTLSDMQAWASVLAALYQMYEGQDSPLAEQTLMEHYSLSILIDSEEQ